MHFITSLLKTGEKVDRYHLSIYQKTDERITENDVQKGKKKVPTKILVWGGSKLQNGILCSHCHECIIYIVYLYVYFYMFIGRSLKTTSKF